MRPERRVLMKAATAVIGLVLLAAGCGGSDTPSEPLRDGVYEYELSKSYLLENGIGQYQADEESGMHTATLDGGSFEDKWTTAEGRSNSCRGTYEADGTLVTFRWTYNCWGDWEMRYGVEGATVTWSDVEALPPYDTDEDQNVTEVFNGIPWKRVGDVPKED
jgi:hypothetical protein